MVSELWFYATTVLICTGYALLLHSYPQWKIYLSVALAAFTVGGAVLVYFDAKEREDTQTKISQLQRMLEVAKQDAEKQQALTRDATDRARLLAEQLQAKSRELSTLLKDKPHIEGDIRTVRIFPWQRASGSQQVTDSASAATAVTGLIVEARIENQGSSTTLSHWELTIELPDKTIIEAQKWPPTNTMRILCGSAPMTVSKAELLDAKTKRAVQRSEERHGATIWMVRNVPLRSLQSKNVVYTLTAKDNIGVAHALKQFTVLSSPEACSGFDVLD